MAYERRSFAGAAPAATLSTGISSGDMTITISSGTGWPTGGNGDFFIVLDQGNAGEEKVRCASRSGTSITVQTAGRGVDGTSAAAHTAGVNVEHCGTATDADEANLAVSKTIAKATAAGQILVVDAANSFAAVQAKTSGQILVGNGTTLASVAVSGDATLASTGAVTIAKDAAAGTASMRTLGTSATSAAAGNDSRLTNSRAPSGAAGGTLGGTYPNPTVSTDGSTLELTPDVGSGSTVRMKDGGTTLAKLADQANATILGNRSGSTGPPSAMTTAQTMALLSGNAGAAFSMNSQKISSLATPTATTDAATKAYVDRTRTRYVQTLPTNGNWTNGQTIATLTITDPGFNITVWASGTVLATADTLAYWEMQCYIDGVKSGGIVIPQANNSIAQTYAVLGRNTAHSTGTDCTVLIKVALYSGTGGFATLANTGANNLLTAWYTWDGT